MNVQAVDLMNWLCTPQWVCVMYGPRASANLRT